MKNLPTTRSTIDLQFFVHVLTKNEQNAVRKLMINHDININVVASLKLSRGVAIYTVYETDSNGYRYVDDETGEIAVRTVRHKIK